jgi:chromodomain-helicase-DNA-binding protein 1
VDEAHRLKNKDRELHTSLAGLSSANRLLVSGTPPRNFVAELVGIAALVESRPV